MIILRLRYFNLKWRIFNVIYKVNKKSFVLKTLIYYIASLISIKLFGKFNYIYIIIKNARLSCMI